MLSISHRQVVWHSSVFFAMSRWRPLIVMGNTQRGQRALVSSEGHNATTRDASPPADARVYVQGWIANTFRIDLAAAQKRNPVARCYTSSLTCFPSSLLWLRRTTLEWTLFNKVSVRAVLCQLTTPTSTIPEWLE